MCFADAMKPNVATMQVFFRVEDAAIKPLLRRAGFLTAVGALGLLASGLPRSLLAHGVLRLALALTGGLASLVGIVLAFVFLPRLLWKDAYLGATELGVVFATDAFQGTVPWDELASIASRSDGVVFSFRSGEERVVAEAFFDAAHADIASALEPLRRRATMGLPPR